MEQLTLTDRRNVYVLSDTVLYPEAVAFVRKLVVDEECAPLPPSQIAGLLNIAHFNTYTKLYDFILHQRDRDWPESKSDVKKFYTALERYFADMARRRIKDEFHLLREGLNARDAKEMTEDIMILLAQEFIQHFITENNLLASERVGRRRRQYGG